MKKEQLFIEGKPCKHASSEYCIVAHTRTDTPPYSMMETHRSEYHKCRLCNASWIIRNWKSAFSRPFKKKAA